MSEIPVIMGILNITPDSFSDGDKFLNIDCAIRHADFMIESGAEIIDIGGESTRPGAKAVDVQIEISRVIPVIERLKGKCKISIDTYNSQTALKAVKAGAEVINDITALQYDPMMVKVLKDNIDIKIVLMHKKGNPADMQNNPKYDDLMEEIMSFFKERIDFCNKNGIKEDRIIIDPGIGFGKDFGHNITLLKNIEALKVFGLPILLGASRKSFINQIYPSSPEDRLMGSLATTALALIKKIDYIRVHDVQQHCQFIKSLTRML